MKKIFTLTLAVLFLMQGIAFAKKNPVPEIPLEDRIKIEVEVIDKTSFRELDTVEILRGVLQEKIFATNIFNVITEGEITTEFTDLKSLGEKTSSADVGELLYFNPAEVADSADMNANLTQEHYSADYLLRCQILGLGTTSKAQQLFGDSIGIGIGRSSHFGIGIFNGIGRNRTVYCVAVNVQLINVESNLVLWQRNFVGQNPKHRKPSKGYDDAFDEAYLKSIKKAAEQITERLQTYATKFLISKSVQDDD